MSEKHNPWQRIVPMVGILAGVVSLMVGLYNAWSTASFLQASSTATGTIIRLVERQDADAASPSYAPVYTFTSDTGKSYTVTSDVSSLPAVHFVGEIVHVRYPADDPARARIDSFWQLWTNAVIAAVIGVMFLGFCIMALLKPGVAQASTSE